MILHRIKVYFLLISAFTAFAVFTKELPIVVVIASYNNFAWYEQNLNSVFMQKYDNYRVIYVDDCSTDNTGECVENLIQASGKQDKFTIIKNRERKGALYNQYHAIHSCKNNEIVLILDGDDWFANDFVFSYISHVYSNPDVWMTYGQFQFYPTNEHGFCCQMPSEVIAHNWCRQFQHIPSHLRTFYAGLFKKINSADLSIDGMFFPMTGDMATMIPMMEMAGTHYAFIPEILYIYNDNNPLSDHRVSKFLQRILDLYIRKLKPYQPLQSRADFIGNAQ